MPQRNSNAKQFSFVNFTDMEDSAAREKVGELRRLFLGAERDREEDILREKEAIACWKNELWSDDDLEFFDQFDITPYYIPEGRAPLNNLVSQQRQSRYEFGVVPMDKQSFSRHRKGREKFVEEHGDDFTTLQQAQEYYDNYYDDELASTLEAYLTNVRWQSDAKHEESEAFEYGIIAGNSFLKTIWNDGDIKTDHRVGRQMIWDRSSTDYLLDDAEYIGEVHRLYKQDMISLFPERKEEIEQQYSEYTNFERGVYSYDLDDSWENFYDFDSEHEEASIKVAELWYKETEERYEIVYNDSQETRVIKHDLEEEQIWEQLYDVELDEITQAVNRGEMSLDYFDRPEREVKKDIQARVDRKYSLRRTQVPIWYKAVFTYNGLFEHRRSPFPHESHPYTPFFAQYTDGWYTGIMDDIKDLILAINKATMFRELMLSHGAKGALVVDRRTMADSNYDVDDIKQMWSEFGTVIDLELKGNRRLNDVFQQITTIDQGLFEIRSVIQELKQKIYEIMGVNQAQLGNVGNEAAASQVRQRIVQGQQNNGVIFDNFNRTLEAHTKRKVLPLVVQDLMMKKPKAVRSIADNRMQWIELNYDEEFDLFVDAIQSGNFATMLKTKEEDKQLSTQHSAMLMELAMNGALNPETAIEFSDLDNSHKILKRDKEISREKAVSQAALQVDLRTIQQRMLEQGLDSDTVDEMIRQLRLEKAKELEQQQEQRQQTANGMNAIQEAASQSDKQAGIDRNISSNTMNQNPANQ